MASLAGITLTLVLLTLSPAILGIKVCPAGQTAARPGSCPTILKHCNMLPLLTNCSCDAQCPGVQKCCELSCSINCADPVFPVHPGQCPTGTFHCPVMDSTNSGPKCAHDGDCSLPKKCCKVCGQTCVDPQPVHPGECPPQIFLCPVMDSPTPAPECAHDGDCSLPKKCCNKCGLKCVDPLPAKPVPADN